MKNSILTPNLLKNIVSQFRLSNRSVHGPAHWMRVRANGLLLSEYTGANTKVVELFAVFHDACRENDMRDPNHGPRAAELATYFSKELKLFSCSSEELELLVAACVGHTYGGIHEDPTIGTCWDADRLDLPRVGIEVKTEFLCTDAAKGSKIIDQARNNAYEWLLRN